MGQSTVKQITLYAYKIENDKISKAYSDFFDKLSSKLKNESSVEDRCMEVSETTKETDFLASYIKNSNYIWGNLMRIAPTKDMPSLPDDFLKRKTIAYSELEEQNVDEKKRSCKYSYYFVMNKKYLITNIPSGQILRFKTYVNWLLEADRGDTLYNFSILIKTPKDTKMSDLASIVFSGEDSRKSMTPQKEESTVSLKVTNLMRKSLSALFSNKELTFLIDKRVLSANLVVNIHSLRKGNKDEEKVKKALSAVITPIMDDDGISFKTKDNRTIKAGEMIFKKKTLVNCLSGGSYNEQDLQQQMLDFLGELKNIKDETSCS